MVFSVEEIRVAHIVDTVDPELLIEANQAVASRKGKGDATITLIAHFNGRLPPETLLAINYRLIALAHFVESGGRSPWILDPKGKRYKLIQTPLLRAAAVTTLSIEDNRPISELAFDADIFQKNALESSETEGGA